MSNLIHYTNPMSRGVRTQRILQIFEIPHEERIIDFKAGENRTPEYLKIHPYGRVPALVHGDTTIVESGAITLYLADLFPDKLNTPKVGTPERALLYEWVLFIQSTLEQVAMQAFTAEDKSECRAKVRELFEAMAGRFRGPFVLGDTFSVLDVILHTELSWYQMMELFPEGLEPYQSFMEHTQKRLGLEKPVTS
ncbi:MAG: glutathione S-transferase family protein [Vulcanimicrobiota bacterium]